MNDLFVWAALLGVLGLCFGSFFNVVIGRWPLGQSVVRPASRCPKCGSGIRSRHNIPVLGWLMLGGKCYDCKAPISKEYPLVELTTGVLAAAPVLWPLVEPSVSLEQVLRLSLLLVVSVPVIVVDLRHFLIPNIVVWPGFVLALGVSFIPGGMDPASALWGGVGLASFLWFVGWFFGKILKREAMGFGDVQLVALTGAILGPWAGIASLPISAVLALVAMAFWRFAPQNWRPDASAQEDLDPAALPFGPFLCLGAALTLLFGQDLWDWYFTLVTN